MNSNERAKKAAQHHLWFVLGDRPEFDFHSLDEKTQEAIVEDLADAMIEFSNEEMNYA